MPDPKQPPPDRQTPVPPGSRSPFPPPPGPGFRFYPLVLALLALGALLWMWRSTAEQPAGGAIPYSELYAHVQQGDVEQVTIRGQEIRGQFEKSQDIDGQSVETFRSVIPEGDEGFVEALREANVRVDVIEDEPSAGFEILVALFPWLLLIGFWIWITRRARRMGEGMSPFGAMGKPRVKKYQRDRQVRTRFDDVAGLRWAKQDLREVVEFLKSPERFRAVGGNVPRGILLAGPPGTGKTLLARAVAGESGVPFFSISGSEFIELFVGVGAQRVRELFDAAKKASPAIVFIDEIDAVGRARGAGLGGGHDEREQTLNQLLSEMDGFDSDDLVVVMAATNRPDVLDPALLRPGRFDRRVMVNRPEAEARQSILEVHARGKPLADDVDLGSVARSTSGFSGADLKALVNEAAISAARNDRSEITSEDFTHAFDKIVLGDPREGKLNDEEKTRVAVHESGHALVAHLSPRSEPLRRVTILPRGMGLGATQQMPPEDRHIMTEPELLSRLKVLMGGYAAERAVFGDTSSGAEDDLKKASQLAFKMVAHYGMSSKVGPMYHEHKTDHPFLGQRVATESGTSDATVRVIEEECRRLLAEAARGAQRIITEQRERLERLVSALLDRETLERTELLDLLGPSAAGAEQSSRFQPHAAMGGEAAAASAAVTTTR